jgi:ABC-type Zn uptake system ZnuABC Zn-binding protein ZnuA
MTSRMTTIIVSAALLLAACQPAASTTAPAASADRLNVVATHSILGDFVREVAGQAVELTVLVGPDGDVHNYEPAPGDSRALAEADVLIENGLEFETWLDELYTAAGAKATRIAASDGIEPLAAEEHDEEEGQAEEAHGEFDPHIWQSVPNAMQMVRNIRAGLAAADPAQASLYQANADAYLLQLQDLHDYVLAQAGTLPPDRRKLVTNHDALGYLAHEYGFTIVGDALGSVNAEAVEPSAAQIAALADAIRAEGIPAIFAENVEGSQVIEQVAREAGVRVAPLLYTDALGPAGSEGESYLKMMRYNIDTIVSALK